MTTAEIIEQATPTLQQLIRERLEFSDDPDPRAVVDDLLADLGPEQREDALRYALGILAVAVARRERTRALAPQNGKVNARWDNPNAALAERPDVLGQRLYLGEGRWKLLGDCTPDDLAAAEEIDRSRGEGLIRRADHYAALGALLRKRRGKRVVRDLRLADVEKIFDA